jgi:cyanophycin synthetase
VLRTQVDVVLPQGAAVLNAADAVVAEMAPLCDGDVIFYAEDPELPVIVEHLAQCRRAVIVRQGQVLLAEGMTLRPVVALADVQLGADIAPEDRTAVLLASLAAAWALGVSPELMAAGLQTFERDAPIAHPPLRRVSGVLIPPEPTVALKSA